MKILCLSLSVLLLEGLIGGSARAADDGWYVAADLGRSSFDSGALNGLVPAGWDSRISDHDTGHRLTGGYQFDSNWGLEASFVDLGTATVDSENPKPIGIPDVPTFFDDTLTAKGWELAGVGTYPFGNGWAVFGRLGALRGELQFQQQSNGFIIDPNADVMQIHWRATFGFGAAWSFAQDWSVHTDWNHYPRLGADSIGHYDINLFTLGLTYHFRG